MSVEIKPEGDSVRIRVDRVGIAAVSALLGREEAVGALNELASLLGYTVNSIPAVEVHAPGAGHGDGA